MPGLKAAQTKKRQGRKSASLPPLIVSSVFCMYSALAAPYDSHFRAGLAGGGASQSSVRRADISEVGCEANGDGQFPGTGSGKKKTAKDSRSYVAGVQFGNSIRKSVYGLKRRSVLSQRFGIRSSGRTFRSILRPVRLVRLSRSRCLGLSASLSLCFPASLSPSLSGPWVTRRAAPERVRQRRLRESRPAAWQRASRPRAHAPEAPRHPS